MVSGTEERKGKLLWFVLCSWCWEWGEEGSGLALKPGPPQPLPPATPTCRLTHLQDPLGLRGISVKTISLAPAWPLTFTLSKFLMEILLGLPRWVAQGPGTPSTEKASLRASLPPTCLAVQGHWVDPPRGPTILEDPSSQAWSTAPAHVMASGARQCPVQAPWATSRQAPGFFHAAN